MSDADALAGFLDKWLARWPEWAVAETFVPHVLRQRAAAWFALRQELTDAAWGGSDPRPGEAKLGWWVEELSGWTRGARRHPLGLLLQPVDAPWGVLAAGLPSLHQARERAVDAARALVTLEPAGKAFAATSAALFAADAPASARDAAWRLLGEQLLAQGEGAVPLLQRARLGADADAQALRRAWAEELLAGWPVRDPSRAERIRDALLHARLQAIAGQGAAASRWRTLWRAWNAARG
ncbi:MAG TPA: phytoene/squalene synthase family protein [Xanthomonadaceae bacterium]|nr:phytoene/squalene synthase family protein [Xanthomonadaceae bacterium]